MIQQVVEMKARLLVADDDGLVLATISAGLRQLGYDVIEASSGDEAIELCKTTHPDLALLDMRMPGKSGIEVAREIAVDPGVPFMFLSAFDGIDIVDSAVSEGALGYLVKPIDVNQIVPSIEAALQRSGEIRSLHDSKNNLTHALNTGRETNVAIGIVMARTGISSEAAEIALRTYARSTRRKMNDIAAELVKTADALSTLLNAITEKH